MTPSSFTVRERKWVGRIEASEKGSSTKPRTESRIPVNWSRVKVRAVCREPIRRATERLKGDSSKDSSSKSIENVRRSGTSSAISAETALESTPPDSSEPIGTSETSRHRIASVSASRSSSDQASSESPLGSGSSLCGQSCRPIPQRSPQ